jgi:hypothetical protein
MSGTPLLRSLPPLLAGFTLLLPLAAAAQAPPGEAPALGSVRITQQSVEDGDYPLLELRRHGRRIFSTPFNHLDGFGDDRPSLQGSGAFLRVDGLDAQTCLECHSIGSFATVPFSFEVGGVGGGNTNVIGGPTFIDPLTGDFDGRFINPPFVFGAGGVELLAKEMTAELQDLKDLAEQNPGVPVELLTKGVSFGTLIFDGAVFDTSGVEGIDDDLVVKPFGRKGEFISIRDFASNAFRFHFGIQPVERVGPGDPDGDGVEDELLEGEVSAVHVFGALLERPRFEESIPGARWGRLIFDQIACGDCHVPELATDSRRISFSFPEVPDDPSANVYLEAWLTRRPARFAGFPGGGVRVPLFSDLKRHDMGPGLAESTGGDLDAMFITARLWGVADTAPYLHDGRALTLTDAILAHGGPEATASRDAFEALPDADKVKLLDFLRSLRTPRNASTDLDLF